MTQQPRRPRHFYVVPGGVKTTHQTKEPKMTRHEKAAAAIAFGALAFCAFALLWPSIARPAAAAGCQITIPKVTAQADGTGTQTGHVHGTCPFAWHSTNQISYQPEQHGGRQAHKWHVLGTEHHPGGAAGAYVVQPIDRDDYRGDGYWREQVIIYDQAGHERQVIIGPTSEFDAGAPAAAQIHLNWYPSAAA